MRRRYRAAGLTLIELMIVVAIIGVLASIAVPSYLKFSCRAKQTEAKGALHTLYMQEEGYRGEFGVYSNDLQTIGFKVKGNNLYTYSITLADARTFVAIAQGQGPMNGDAWQVDQTGEVLPTTTHPDCE